MKKNFVWALTVASFAVNLSIAYAQDAPATGAMDHGQMDHGQAEQPSTREMPAGAGGMDHGSMQQDAPEDARDPHAYSGGYDLGPLDLHLADEHRFASLLVDELEAVRSDDESFTAYDLQAWYGTTYNRAVFKAEGEIDDSELEEARSELLWGRAIAPFWDAQLGLRYDSGEGPDASWLAFGVQGLAPYWFEVEAFGYVGEEGRTALRLDASYELLLTQKWVVEPAIEANFYGKEDAERELGSGLSDITAGLRLRYEIRREFAPYIGVEYAAKFGGTADFARAEGEDTRTTRLVAGLRFWF